MTAFRFTQLSAVFVFMVILLLVYLLGIPVNYLIAKAALKKAHEGEWTQGDKFPALVTSILSFLGAAAWSLIYLAIKFGSNYNKPAKW